MPSPDFFLNFTPCNISRLVQFTPTKTAQGLDFDVEGLKLRWGSASRAHLLQLSGRLCNCNAVMQVGQVGGHGPRNPKRARVFEVDNIQDEFGQWLHVCETLVNY